MGPRESNFTGKFRLSIRMIYGENYTVFTRVIEESIAENFRPYNTES